MPDWNIVDDEPDDAANAAPEAREPDDVRLDPNRIRTVMLERRAAYQRRQWAIGGTCFALIAAAVLVERAIAWDAWTQRGRWSAIAMVAAFALIVLAARLFRTLTRKTA